MPLYEYKCIACHKHTEKIQKFSDRPIRKCPECGGPVEKVMHAPAVQFKGTGWYVTDYAAKSDKTDKSKTESGSDKATPDKKETTAKDDGAKGKDKEAKPKKTEAKKSKD